MKPVRLQSCRRSQFNSRKQASRERVTDSIYARAQQQLMEKAYAKYELEPSLRDTILLGQVEQGLLEKWKEHLRHPIDSFEEALHKARMAEAVESQLLSRSTEAGGNAAESLSKRPPQQAETPPTLSREKPPHSHLQSVTCFNCHKQDHYASECKTKATGKKTFIKCFECQQRGHYARNALHELLPEEKADRV